MANKAKSLMVMGTASDVGKSVIVTALCRAFARRGVRVAPFKAQNMSNNSAVCVGGGEIGRAQAVQAQACGLEATVDMNPILLKPESDGICQVVVRGRARFRMGVHDYEHYRRQAWPEIVQSYARLSEEFDLVIIEGAGGAAEINLRDRDIVNWAIADLADAPVILAADIDKGGVFASLIGTVELLLPSERARVQGFLINKFRGDATLLQTGIRYIEYRTGIPALGLLPWIEGLRIAEEDAVRLDYMNRPNSIRPVTIGVVHLPRISNFTDFAPLDREPDVTVHYVSDPADAPQLDVVIVPGTKSTIADLSWTRRAGWESFVVRQVRGGRWILGICGGYQMLGRRILDPYGVESETSEAIGLGFLDIETRFEPAKITALIEGYELSSSLPIRGYEIHAGRVTLAGGSRPLLRLTRRDGESIEETEGCKSQDGRVIGTSVHGLFDSPGFRRSFVDHVRESKGLPRLSGNASPHDDQTGTGEYDRLADIFQAHADFARIAAMAGQVREPVVVTG